MAGNLTVVNGEVESGANFLISQLRQTIFEADDILHEDVYVKEWNVTLRVWGLTSERATKLWQNAVNQETRQVDLNKIYPELVIFSCRAILENGETGPYVFSNGDKDLLVQRSARVIERLAKTAMIVSGMKEDTSPDLEQAKSETTE